jgi:RimJ/RimL family protein N-acetyltransferase
MLQGYAGAMSESLMETERLFVRQMREDDAEFYLAMLSDPDFKQHIADRGVRDVEGALANMRDRVLTSYDAHGFGMWLVGRRDTGEAVGMAGLVKRDFLKDVDLGYAFLPAGRGAGYVTEVCQCIMDYAALNYGIQRLSAIVSPENGASIRVLERLGFHREGQVQFPDDGDTCELFLVDLAGSGRENHGAVR